VSCDSSLAKCEGTVCIATNAWVVDFQGHAAHWDGMNWSAGMSISTNQISLAAINGSSALDVWAVGSATNGSPHAAAFRLGTGQWSQYDISGLGFLNSVWGTSGTDFWAVGAAGSTGAVAHFDGGLSWTTATGLGSIIWSLWGTGPNDVWAVGASSGQGALFHWSSSSNLATPDTHLVSGTTSLVALWGSGRGDLWAVGYGPGSSPAAVLAYWSDGLLGAPTVYTISGISSYLLQAIWGSGVDDVWAVGSGQTIVHWTNGPSVMPTIVETGNGSVDFEGIWGSGRYDVWAVGPGLGGGAATHWTGTAWSTPIPLTGIQDARAVWGLAR
jgi:hypothetical protein